MLCNTKIQLKPYYSEALCDLVHEVAERVCLYSGLKVLIQSTVRIDIGSSFWIVGATTERYGYPGKTCVVEQSTDI